MRIDYDVSRWTQREKNFIQAAAVKLLFDAGITYDKCKGSNNGYVDIENPSADPTSIISATNMLTWMQAKFAQQAIIDAEAQAEEVEKRQELTTNDLKDLKISQVDNWIDNQIDGITDLASAKQYLRVFSKRVVRLFVATIRF